MTFVRRFALAACCLLAPAALAAQVGHPPATSPYTDIHPQTSFELVAGMIGGGGGPLRVGPRDGPVGGARVLLRSNSTISLGFGIWGGQAKRTLVDPDATLATRFGASVDQGLYGAEALLQLNVTGGKAWHHLAPFVGLGLGAVKTGQFDDVSGYEFGTKFYFAPMVGSRVFVSRRLYLRAEGRAFAWKLKYPPSFSQEPDAEPGTAEHPNALNPSGSTGQYVLAPTAMFGFGFSF